MTTRTRFAFSLALVTAATVAAGPAFAQSRPTSAPAPGNGGAAPSRPATPPATRGSVAAVPAPAAKPVTATVPLPSDYVIGPGDILQISVWKNDALSRVAPVRPDGKISMPLLYDIQASGLTAMQLRDKIAHALGEFLPNPEVAVSINEVHSLRVSVLGEVQKPGVLELRGATTVLEAIAMAGGLKDFASPSKISVIRNENGQTKKIRFNYNRVLKGAKNEENFTLKSGDVVVVP
jgi:polysaccharide export outer membrane protein